MNVIEKNSNSDVAIVKQDGGFYCVCCSIAQGSRFLLTSLPELVEHLQEHADAGDLVPVETFEFLKEDMEKQIARFENKNRLIFAVCLVCGVFAITYLLFQVSLTPEDVIFAIVVLVSILMVVFLS